MVERIIRAVLTLLGGIIGLGAYSLFETLFSWNFEGYLQFGINSVFVIIFALILFFVSRKIIDHFHKLEETIQKVPFSEVILGSIGLIIGLVIAFLISQIFYQINIPYVANIVSIILYLLLGYLGAMVPLKRKDDIANLSISFKKNTSSQSKEKYTLKNVKSKNKAKVLDTSVIIDGRIADICATGFIEGPLVIPEFVLGELQYIADSSDGMKRKRGRRGLDVLNRIQKEIDIEVIISDKDFEEISEVDMKLLKLGQLLKGKVVTNDYNLNKVAEFHGVEVLNINELANAVKPVVLPGEVMYVDIIKEGKEAGQGLAYLDDGTMIVIEGGKKHLENRAEVEVSSVLQTAAGKMIFAKVVKILGPIERDSKKN